ncbi:MAG: class I SAM-dependent methyltransferase [Caldilineaceae bacterium]|nr:class I SAM-dependent methyltransferase [Caldilineaceae bacterium]
MQLTTYGKLNAAQYALDNQEPPAEMFAFYWQQYEAASGPVLEPMCGTGRFLLPFLERGAEIDGMDASAHMLAECRKRLANRGLPAALTQQLIQELDLPRRYGYIFLPDRAISLIYQREVAIQALTRLHDHLLPGGVLALDVQMPGAQTFPLGQWQSDWYPLPDGSLMLDSLLFQLEEDGRLLRAAGKHERFVDGKLVETELDVYVERFYEETEYSALLCAAGFTDIQMSQPFDEANYSGYLVFTCRKED